MKYKHSRLLSSGYLRVSELHELYFEERGSKTGIPLIFIHGGPGGGFSKSAEYFFNPRKFHYILFDQRGVGKSKPFLETKDNDIFQIVDDIEKIRTHFGFDKIWLFGGSFGSTIALTYAIRYPEHTAGMLIRGIFLARQEDCNWLYSGAQNFYWPEYKEFIAEIGDTKKVEDIVPEYLKKITSVDKAISDRASLKWANYELSLVFPVKKPELLATEATNSERQIALMEAFFFANKTFGKDDNYILANIHKAAHIPTYIVHGRYDMVCPLKQAYLVHEAIPGSKLTVVELGGHASSHKPTFKAIQKYLKEIIKNNK